ncbi:MAG: aldolase/citrate lyase family protein [Elioraea sp.]|nr:aldolase/citrate lyase family protein [Elioraea sp.]
MKEKLAKDELVISMIVRLTRGVEIASIAQTAGFDSIYVDMEHNSFSLDATGQICMAAQAMGVTPLVRVPSLAPEMIARTLDAGALGIVAPHVHSAREADEVVRAAKFAPIGERSLPGAMPQLRFRTFPAAETMVAMNDATAVVLMIESREALADVEAIAAVEGVDMLLVGTNDLCRSLGIAGQYDHSAVKDAYARTIEACRRHGKHVGVGGLGSRPDLIEAIVAMGARYVSLGDDLTFLLAGCTAGVKRMREATARAAG